MIKRQQLKCPLIALVVLTILIFLLQIAILILQYLSDYFGYNWTDTPTTTISCDLDSYRTMKLFYAKYTFASGYTALIMASVATLVTLVILLHTLVQFIKAQKNLQQQPGQESMAILPTETKNYSPSFPYYKFIICYICYSISVCGIILEFGNTLWINIIYFLCASIYIVNLLSICALSLSALLLLGVCWIIMAVLRCKIHDYLNDNEQVGSEMPVRKSRLHQEQGENPTMMNLNEVENDNQNQYTDHYIHNRESYRKKKQKNIRNFEQLNRQNTNVHNQQDNHYEIQENYNSKNIKKDVNKQNQNNIYKQTVQDIHDKSHNNTNIFENQYHHTTTVQNSRTKARRDIELQKFQQKQSQNPINETNKSYIEETDHYVKETPKFDQKETAVIEHQNQRMVSRQSSPNKQLKNEPSLEDVDQFARLPSSRNNKPYFKSSKRRTHIYSPEENTNNPFEKYQRDDERKNKFSTADPIEKFYSKSPKKENNKQTIKQMSPKERPEHKNNINQQSQFHVKKKTKNSTYNEYIRGKYEY